MQDTTIDSLARECLERADGDWAGATELMRKAIDQDARLKAELVEPLLDRAIWHVVRKAAHAQRHVFWNTKPEPKEKGGGEGIRAIAHSTYASIYNYPLEGGLKLGDATEAELIANAEQHEGFARANALKARWLRLIAKALSGPRQRVRNALSEEQIENLQKKAVRDG